MKLSFFGRKTNTEGELGAHMRVNTANGNFKLSPTVAKKIGADKGTRLNFSYVENEDEEVEAIYAALEDKGLIIGDNSSFSSTTHADTMSGLYKDEMEGGKDVLIFSVDVENPVNVQNDDNPENDFPAYLLTFKEAQAAKASSPRGSKTEARAEQEQEEEVEA